MICALVLQCYSNNILVSPWAFNLAEFPCMPPFAFLFIPSGVTMEIRSLLQRRLTQLFVRFTAAVQLVVIEVKVTMLQYSNLNAESIIPDGCTWHYQYVNVTYVSSELLRSRRCNVMQSTSWMQIINYVIDFPYTASETDHRPLHGILLWGSNNAIGTRDVNRSPKFQM